MLLASLLLLLAADEAEEASYQALVALFQHEAPEPEPPPGLRAPPDSDRYRRAAEQYEADLARWREEEARRRAELVELAGRHLERFEKGERCAAVLYLRGATLFRSGQYPEARRDLEAFLAADPTAEAAATARQALVACCRAEGDFTAALRYGGPDPDLLEEAGRVKEAIAAAEACGKLDKARGWALIGHPFPGSVKIPAGSGAVVVEAGSRLSTERREALKKLFSPGKVAFLSAPATYPAVYLLDGSGVVRAVDARPDTLEHRLRCILMAR